MSKVTARKKRVNRNVEIGAVDRKATGMVEDPDARIEAIQWLVPLGLAAVAEELHRAVEELAGRRYQRKGSHQPFRRWGCQPGSVFLGDQKVPIDVPRVRNVDSDTEVSLAAYQALRTPRKMDEGWLRRVLKGLATRNYEDCAETLPEAFGLSRSSVSRRCVKGTTRKLRQFRERSLLEVVSHLPQGEQAGVRRKIEAAYNQSTYEEAKAALRALKPVLRLKNQSALHSLEEGLEKTLTLHRLGRVPMLSASFRTTNCIENVHSLLGQLTKNVRRWTNSSHRHRWAATAPLDIESRLRRVKGYRHLPILRHALQADLGIKQLARTG